MGVVREGEGEGEVVSQEKVALSATGYIPSGGFLGFGRKKKVRRGREGRGRTFLNFFLFYFCFFLIISLSLSFLFFLFFFFLSLFLLFFPSLPLSEFR